MLWQYKRSTPGYLAINNGMVHLISPTAQSFPSGNQPLCIIPLFTSACTPVHDAYRLSTPGGCCQLSSQRYALA